ncbi:unnamed protein product [Dibothriocephalus latus]|uniref:Uncharacterized protein n=1 Tax=Dibothriocephalus latus TaxID=60516 RepID=A0A3P7LJ91_DIBLA|nr:unnamed protein product [Dibothriocephalus latus]
MYDSVVNMAAVLNDPLDRQFDIFSRDWGEAFERAVVLPPNQPEITEHHFRTYLSQLSQRRVRLVPPSGEVSAPLSPPGKKLGEISLLLELWFLALVLADRMCPVVVQVIKLGFDFAPQYIQCVQYHYQFIEGKIGERL